MIQPGQIAPDHTLPATDGSLVTLSDLRPRRVVLFFYPRDDTPGCTTEAQDFSARLDDFAAADVAVLGISKDSLARHRSFTEKAGLRVTLLSDAGSDTCERYGVWQEKRMAGRRYMGIVRSTFLIDGTGRVLRVWSPVRVSGHAEEVLAATRD